VRDQGAQGAAPGVLREYSGSLREYSGSLREQLREGGGGTNSGWAPGADRFPRRQSIRSAAILKDRPGEGPKAKIEVKTSEYLASNIDIPSLKFYETWLVEMGATSF